MGLDMRIDARERFVPSGARLPRIAPVGLLVDLVRVVPGYEERCLAGDQENLTFFVLGEWDVLRISLVRSFFPRAKETRAWPDLKIPIQNHHSFLAHIWMDREGAPPSTLLGGGDSIWAFSPDFLSPILPISLLICVKLHPEFTSRFGVFADHAFACHIVEKAHGRGLLILPAGSVGWQEVVFLVRSRSFEEARELVRDVYEVTVADLFPASHATEVPVTARTITYPCIAPESYVDPTPSHYASEEICNATLLLDVRPGIRNPLRGLGPGPNINASGELVLGSFRCSVGELFGEYDLEIRFPEGVPLLEVLRAIRNLRATNLGDFAGWLSGTALHLDFAWRYSEASVVLLRAHKPAQPSLSAEAMKESIGFFRWRGVEEIQSERLIAILRRVASYSVDPVLADSVQPLARYLLALFVQVENIKRRIQEAGLTVPEFEPPTIEIEPEDIDQLCAILEFSLRQRSEGLQQFLFNSLPSSYYGRGGLNRLLVGADAVLREVSDLFQITSPGFVVFGLPNLDGFACFGPIVIAPIPALFKLEWWWVLFHEAALYIDDILFRLEFAEKLVADVITLALPFRFNLLLLCRMHAFRLATIDVSKSIPATPGISIRLGTLVVLTRAVQDLRTYLGPEAMLRLDLIGGSWVNVLRNLSQELKDRGVLYESVSEVLGQFLEDLMRFTPGYRKETVPLTVDDLGLNGASVFMQLADLCMQLAEFSEKAAREGSDAFLAAGYLISALHDRATIVGSTQEDDTVSIASDDQRYSIADLVFRAMRRWESIAMSRREADRTPVPDVQDRLSEFLAVWHRGVLS